MWGRGLPDLQALEAPSEDTGLGRTSGVGSLRQGMSSVEGVRMGRIGGSEGIIFLIYIWVGASDGGEKAVRCLCGPSDTRHVAFPQKYHQLIVRNILDSH